MSDEFNRSIQLFSSHLQENLLPTSPCELFSHSALNTWCTDLPSTTLQNGQ